MTTEIAEIPSIPGALANSEGFVKFPPATAAMPNGGERAYETKWTRGGKRKASKTARHEYYGTLYRGRNYKIHRLVCEAFHGPPPFPGAVVIHLDEDALNNRPSNLRWGTQKENLNMPGFIEYCRGRKGANSGWAKHKTAKACPYPNPPATARTRRQRDQTRNI
jgi:hypothetical protein